jgi:tRNA(fMet)-specific endonuclease VapC
MATALLDTNAVSDLMWGHPKFKTKLASHPDAVVTSVVVLGEIRYGLERLSTGKRRADLESRAHSIFVVLDALPVSDAIVEVYGRVKASLESQGVIVGDNDLWIAATALDLGALLISRDQLFTQIPSLQVADWTI